MKKTIFGILSVFLLGFGIAKAQQDDNLYKDILLSDEVKLQSNTANAEDEARKLLNSKAPAVNSGSSPQLRSKHMQNAKTLAKLSPAPFGLAWGASIAATKDQGVILAKIEEKDYVNNYRASHLPKNVKDFRSVDLTFGQENELWRIIAYGDFLEDDAAATKVLRLYKIYYDLLGKKYGNAQQHFTPRVYNVDVKDKNGKPKTEQREEPLGGPDFLKSLQSGEAVLYATFQGEEVGAALSVNVDGSGKSYIVIDYKSLKILRAREQQTLDAL